MINKQKLSILPVMIVLITALSINPRVLVAQEDFETLRLDLIEFVEAFGVNTDNSKLITDIQAMSSEELQEYHSMLSDPTVFGRANEQAEAFKNLQRELGLDHSPLGIARSHPIVSGFTPDYPSGGNYATYTATLPGLGIMLAGPQNRTDASAVGGALIAFDVLEFANIAAQAVCDGSLLAAPVACPLAAIAAAAARAAQVVLQQADYQDALIDGAEIEAAFENTKILIAQENGINTDLANHDTSIKAQVAAHDTEIKGQLTIHDTDIKNQLSTHDTEIKALLATIQAGVSANGVKLDTLLARQLEVVRLLHTPQGQRATAIPACNGGPCTWNNK